MMEHTIYIHMIKSQDTFEQVLLIRCRKVVWVTAHVECLI